MSTPGTGLGVAVPRLEDERLLRGQGRFVDDLPAEGQLHAVFVRSPHAHARIQHIDVTGARAAPGVVAVYTHADLREDGLRPLHPTVRGNPHDGRGFRYTPQPLLALREVRHVGEAVAMVIAGTPAQALDAAEVVAVDYEPRPAAPSRGAHAEASSLDAHLGDAAAVDAAMARAAHRVRMRTLNHRIIANALENRGAIARHEGGCYELHASTQNVHAQRDQLAATLGVSRHQVRVLASDVGGGFGNRNFTYPEYALLMWAARRSGHPVRWISSRSEGFLSDHQARDFEAEAELALDRDGRFLALRVSSHADLGAYLAGAGCGVQVSQYPATPGGLYAIDAIALHVRATTSTTVPVGVSRGPGFAEAINVIERLIDAAARQTGLCRFELRRRNLVPGHAMPWRNAMGTCIDSGDFPACLEDVLDRCEAASLPARRARALERGRWLGLGVACHVKGTAGLPDENVHLRFEEDRVVLTTGTSAIGQGHETSLRQILGACLGLAPDETEYRAGDSSSIAIGGGHGSSRATVMAGTAIHRAARAVLDAATPMAARVLEASPEELSFEEGRFETPGRNRWITLLDVARLARAEGTPLDTYQRITREAMSYPGGCHAAEVEIDPQTGRIALCHYWAADDYGVEVNPMLVRGQMHGAIAQGAGQALLERAEYDLETGQLISGSFMDYALPRADDLPSFDVTTLGTRCTTNPLGIKGCGEAGAIAGFPAVLNAVADALAAQGVTAFPEPVSAEGIWRAIRDGTTGSPA